MATDQPETREVGERLEWTVWPAARRPVLSVAVAVFGLLLAGVAIWSFGSPWYGFITLIVLAGALAGHYFPTAYRLDDAGVTVCGSGSKSERPWEAFRVALDQGDRIVLSPFSDVNRWLARRRSVTLRLDGNRDEVLVFVAEHVPVRLERP